MQLAIRRVLPTARQKLARPHRFGLPVTTHLRIRDHTKCFSQSCLSLRQLDDSSTPLEKSVQSSTPPGSKLDGAEEAAAPTESNPPREVEAEVPPKESPPDETVVEVSGGNGEESVGEKVARGRGRPAGAKSRRVVVKPRELPKPVIPQWFIERSVRMKEEHGLHDGHLRLSIYSSPPPEEPVIDPATEASDTVLPSGGGLPEGETEVPLQETPAARYLLHESVWQEIKTHVRTGLLLPKGTFMDSMASAKTHCLLHLPKEGGVYYLDALADKLAVEMDADLVRMDAQDFAEIAGDYLGDSRNTSQSDLSSRAIRSLGYDTQVTSQNQELLGDEADEYAESNEEGYEEEEDYSANSTSQPQAVIPNTFTEVLRQFVRSGRIGGAAILPVGEAFGLGTQPDRLNERKMAAVLDAMISSAEVKRTVQYFSQLPSPAAETPEPRPVGKTIVHIRDYRELEQTTSGRALLEILHHVIRDRRREGERIVILGTSSAEEPISTYNKTGVRSLQTRSEDSLERPIVVPPGHEKNDVDLFKSDRDARVREINIRHLQDVIRRRSGKNSQTACLSVPKNWHFKPGETGLASELSERVWTFDRVHRVATVVLGSRPSFTAEITLEDVADAVETINQSDTVKFSWAAGEALNLKRRIEETQQPKGDQPTKTSILQTQKDFTKHEKKLLAGVIDPKDIHTGFSSVHAAPETIEAMKTLTTLSMIRPEAFKYGVLATDRIPGVLLYGPPGTGKTLLAKAVAKETGATVLEVSGAQISDMYVGESEKNVQAIFSLAKKLSPCVVFIDEADAIFGTRQSLHSRSSHRETINQFLKEWADMTSTGFIMVATNRPFDLDDAVLRRLPRRILIDLPTPEDRLAILKIHLGAEILDPSVDLKNIAERTGLYSGSDLKNVCVSAALTCVKEEQAQFEKTKTYPERRVLTKAHFEKALGEISASISDDMGSLALIRKFDDKYGEKAGRKKKVSAWGFELGQTEAGKKGEGRVRMA